MKKIGVLTSGGDAPGMNAAIRAVVRMALSNDMEVYGIDRGYEGLIEGEIHKLESMDVGDILFRGGTILKSARCARFHKDEWVKIAADNLEERGIDALIVIGGDGTFRGGQCLVNHGITVIGIPATIDNDLGYTDYTIGFDTTVNTILDLISKTRDTSSSHERATIIEVMGRHCGDLALYAGLAGGADYIMIPEKELDIEHMIEQIRVDKHNGKLHTIIIKAEGVDIPLKELEEIIEERTGRETRSVVPGYIQRGGTPSAQDRIFASLAGAKAIEVLASDHVNSGVAVGINRGMIATVSLQDVVDSNQEFRQDMYDISLVLG